MTGAEGLAALSREEQGLVSALRDLPPGLLRDRLTALVRELTEFVREPSCPEAQADGVPCASAKVACDECRQVTAVLETLRAGLRRA